ncbi:MAG: hypothetical protein ACREDR_03800 [Blastocatellia bacterium]
MKISMLFVLVVALIGVASVASARPRGQAGDKTVVGYITDSMCGLDHTAMKMGNDKQCTLKCVEAGSKFALADRAHKVVYALDAAGQEKARPFAGERVKVEGKLDAKTKTITVKTIEAAQ